jgi:cytidine deaminase
VAGAPGEDPGPEGGVGWLLGGAEEQDAVWSKKTMDLGQAIESNGMYMSGGDGLASRFMNSGDWDTVSRDEVTDAGLVALMEAAREAALRSYSPYSGFRVGAALRLTSGAVVTGTNVENVSYGLTICAERAALVRAVSEFGPEIRVEAVAVANLNGAASPPCGACRQMLAEFVMPDAPVVFPAADGERVMAFTDVMPLAFEMKLKS